MKRKYMSALLSGLLYPGAGQIANKEYLKGGFIIFLCTALFAAFMCILIMGYVSAFSDKEMFYGTAFDFLLEGLKRSGQPLLLSILGLVVVWVYAIADALIFGSDADEA
ncbi:MAG: hypothetical protein JW984_07380 [Deltaproteobacteria bacterium]|uniref:DUF5683 domain-containing protein n=1 Tax=Candidatus Zymogenus saltonus TaxID=2844893 RepID=A0A9D8KF54_9DELT|nr:hypothetical protein [Candidatus Zymogenus saltonus]